MSSSEIVALHTLLLPLRSILRTRSPAHHTAESRHTTDIAAVSTVCLCTANSGKTLVLYGEAGPKRALCAGIGTKHQIISRTDSKEKSYLRCRVCHDSPRGAPCAMGGRSTNSIRSAGIDAQGCRARQGERRRRRVSPV